MRYIALALIALGLTLGCGGDDGGGGSGGAGNASGAGGSTGVGGGSASCGNIKFVESCRSNNGTGTCYDLYDDTFSPGASKQVCDAMGPGTLDATAKCDPTTGFGACVTNDDLTGICRVFYWGPPQFSDASIPKADCEGANGTWYPH